VSKVKKPFSILLAVILDFFFWGWKDCLVWVIILIRVIDIFLLAIYFYRLLVQIILVLYLILLIGLPSIALHIVYYNVRYLSLDDIADNILNFLDRKIHTSSSTNYSSNIYVDGFIWTPEVLKNFPKDLRQYFIDLIWKGLDYEVRKFYSRKYGKQLVKIGACNHIHIKREMFIDLINKMRKDGLITDSKGIDLVCIHYPVSRFRRRKKKLCPFLPANSIVRLVFQALFESPELTEKFNSHLKEVKASKMSIIKRMAHYFLFSFLNKYVGIDIRNEETYMASNSGPCTNAIKQYSLCRDIIKVHCPKFYDLFIKDYKVLQSCTRPTKSLCHHYQIISTLYSTKKFRKHFILCIENEVCKHYKLDQDLTDWFIKLTNRKSSL